MIQSNIEAMEKQPLGPEKIDNKLIELIQRYPGVRTQYKKLIREQLAKSQKKVYAPTMIWRVVTNQKPLNSRNIVIKEALEEVCKTYEQQLQPRI